MEKGNLRADVNVSVRKPGAKLGTRCEIKNVNSIRFIGQAIEYEARRQIDIIEDGGVIEQETRLFDSAKGVTRSMRSKEEAHDYRYFPDPDLLPLELTQAYVDGLKAGLPELPDAKKARFMRDYKLSAYDAGVLVAERESADFFEACGRRARRQDGVRTGSSTSCSGASTRRGLDDRGKPDVGRTAGRHHRPHRLGCDLRQDRQGPVRDRLERGWRPRRDRREARPQQVTDTGAIETAVDAVIAANPDKVAAVKAKPAMLGWFVGQVMKSTGGKANPQAVNELLKKKLGL